MTGDAFSGAGATAIGGRRANEDAFVADSPVFVVADGMGGHAAGAEAAAATVGAFASLAGSGLVPPAIVEASVSFAQLAVIEVGDRAGAPSGSTVTGAIAVEHLGAPWWLVINVGDSRVYAVEDGEATQITHDHSLVQEMVDAGEISQDEAAVHPERNVVTRAIGDGVSRPDSWLVPARAGMRLVAASDGLTRELDDDTIAALATGGTPGEAAQALVDAAVAAGASDNVTVVVAETSATTPDGADPSPWEAWPGA